MTSAQESPIRPATDTDREWIVRMLRASWDGSTVIGNGVVHDELILERRL